MVSIPAQSNCWDRLTSDTKASRSNLVRSDAEVVAAARIGQARVLGGTNCLVLRRTGMKGMNAHTVGTETTILFLITKVLSFSGAGPGLPT